MKTRLVVSMMAGAVAAAAFAQQPTAPAPAWKQGMSEEQAKSTLHPFAPHLTGRPAKDLPIDKLRVPAGFQVEVWAEDVPEARSLALGDKGTVFVSNRNLSNVYAITDSGGKRTVKTIFKGLNSPTASPSRPARCMWPSAIRSPPIPASRIGWTARQWDAS